MTRVKRTGTKKPADKLEVSFSNQLERKDGVFRAFAQPWAEFKGVLSNAEMTSKGKGRIVLTGMMNGSPVELKFRVTDKGYIA